MAVEFARKLKDIIDVAARDSRAELRFALHMIADIILETFDSDLQSLDIDCRTTLDVMQIAHDAAHTIDACSVVETAVLAGSAERCVKELALPVDRSHDALARFLEQLCRAMESRPFVHVVWRDPAEILHVGSRRGDDARWPSPTLLGALHHGSHIALLIPPPNAAATVSDVEAALVSVLGRRTALGDRERAPARVPRAVGAAHLAEIGRLLGELASKFRAPAAAIPELPGGSSGVGAHGDAAL